MEFIKVEPWSDSISVILKRDIKRVLSCFLWAINNKIEVMLAHTKMATTYKPRARNETYFASTLFLHFPAFET